MPDKDWSTQIQKKKREIGVPGQFSYGRMQSFQVHYKPLTDKQKILLYSIASLKMIDQQERSTRLDLWVCCGCSFLPSTSVKYSRKVQQKKQRQNLPPSADGPGAGATSVKAEGRCDCVVGGAASTGSARLSRRRTAVRTG